MDGVEAEVPGVLDAASIKSLFLVLCSSGTETLVCGVHGGVSQDNLARRHADSGH